jgi:L-galactose dehydrogenase
VDYVTLGRTGLSVSLAGLGCGGKSRLGLGQGSGPSRADAVRIVRAAIDLGVNYLDTAAAYGTQEIVGEAIAGCRDGVVVTTKVRPVTRDRSGRVTSRLDGRTLPAAVRESLSQLRTDVIDVLMLHSVYPADYDYCRAELLPCLGELRTQGLIRFTGISERFESDPSHELLTTVVGDDEWDVLLVGFNVLNSSARAAVLPGALSRGLGVTIMFAVRDLLSRPPLLRAAIRDAVRRGEIDGALVDAADPLGFLVHPGGAGSLVEAAYRFARHASGAHVVLTGTGSIDHLRQNVSSVSMPPLPAADAARLQAIFGGSSSLTSSDGTPARPDDR